MAIVLEEFVTGGTDSAGSFTLTSWTPGANELVLLFVNQRNETITPTASGNGLTFVEHASVDNTQGQNGMSCFRAMGASPSTGQITVTLTGNTTPANAIAMRISGVDTSGTNGSGAVEASGTAPGPAVDDDDALVTVTTVTDNAWAVGAIGHRNTTFTVPGDQTSITNVSNGTGGDTTRMTAMRKSISPAGSATLGGTNSLAGANDWFGIAVAVKPDGGGGGGGVPKHAMHYQRMRRQ